MPSFNPFTSVTGRNAYTLFDIRLENDFIVFRGNEHESSGQLLKGVVVLCLPAPLKVEDVHLRLTGTLRLAWSDSRVTASGMSNQKVDKTQTILNHKWAPFEGGAHTPGASRSILLPAGNYEWPFELMLPGDTCESVEGMQEAGITYKLKATVARGKLAYDLHAYKRLRVIRTLEASALEFLHAMSVENIWPNKVEYSIVIPQKAVVFGSAIPLETRFTPLLKGLELGDITIKMVEVHDVIIQTPQGHNAREHRKEREVASWTIPMSREEHWQDMIEDTGQEGWVMSTSLDLPRTLGKCLQDVNVQGIKIRHKLKMVVALQNPDGHVSELRATLPVTIFISPNMPLDEEGNLMRQLPQGTSAEEQQPSTIAPPGYGAHVLDQLYEDMEANGLQTPALQSGVNSPFYGQSRAGSSENLAALMTTDTAVAPAALTSRLQSVSLDPSHRNTSYTSIASGVGGHGGMTPQHAHDSHQSSQPTSAPLSRQTSDEDHHSSRSNSPEHVDFVDWTELTKVPSYQTALRTPARTLTLDGGSALPDYQTATSAPPSPRLNESPIQNPLELIREVSNETRNLSPNTPPSRPAIGRRRQTSQGFSHAPHHITGDMDERRRLHLIQARERVA